MLIKLNIGDILVPEIIKELKVCWILRGYGKLNSNMHPKAGALGREERKDISILFILKIMIKYIINRQEFIMIREIIKAEDNILTIKIPQEFVGREIEYIVFPVNSDTKKETKNSSISMLAGSLNKYADPSKRELEDKAWELHIMDKFAK